MKKKSLLAIISLVLCLGVTSACGSTPTVSNQTTEAEATQEVVSEEESEDAAKEQTQETAKEKAESEDTEVESEDDKTEIAEDDKAEAKEAEDDKAADDKSSEPEYMADVNMLDKPATMYASSAVNVRKGPATSYEKLGYLELNEEISVIGEYKNTNWKAVTYKGSTAFVHGSRLGNEKVDLAAMQAAAEQAARDQAAQAAATQAQASAAPVQAAPAQAAPAPAPQQPATPKAKNTSGGILFIGDSRTCQMRDSTGGAGCGWVCQYGADYGWFASTGVPTADPMIGAGTKVVICMGVNDPGSIYSYANLVNQKAAEWVGRGAKVYYVSLNPVDHPYEDKIIPIDSFNATMPSQLANVYWIDTYNVVKQGGFVLEDGIHYDAAGNINIFNMIIGCLR